jgi:hypothetical protein
MQIFSFKDQQSLLRSIIVGSVGGTSARTIEQVLANSHPLTISHLGRKVPPGKSEDHKESGRFQAT